MIILPYNSTEKPHKAPWMTFLLIASNCGVFFYMFWMGDTSRSLFLSQYAAIPSLFFTFSSDFPYLPLDRIPTLFSCIFIHASILHLASNMLYLMVFGANVEDRLGHFGFLVFYLFCGLIACLTWCIFNIGSSQMLVGASGSIAGILAVYLLAFPGKPIKCLVILILKTRLPAFVVLGYWILMEVAITYMNFANMIPEDDGVAHLAHLGGFAAGILWFIKSGKQKKRRI
jgi:rhomboid family protein